MERQKPNNQGNGNNKAGGRGGTQTKSNGGATQVITKRQQQQQEPKQKQQQQPKQKKKNLKGGVRLDGEVDDELNIQNEQNQKWQCPKCKYVNNATSLECEKCIHLAALKKKEENQEIKETQ